MDKPIQVKKKPWEGNRTNFDRNLALIIGSDRHKKHTRQEECIKSR